MKFCEGCKDWIKKSEFARHPASYDRLQRICKPCVRERARQYYQDNRQKMIEKNIKWIDNNRKRHNEIAMECRKRNDTRNSSKEIN